jgi:Helix-turn-helix
MFFVDKQNRVVVAQHLTTLEGMNMASIPEPWNTAMTKAGLLDARFGNPSMSELARVAGVHTTTISTLILKGKKLSPKNMVAVAEALQVPLGELTKWVTGETTDPYIPPAGAEHLTHRERHALDELILTMIDKKVSSDKHDDDHDDAQKTGMDPRHSRQTPKIRRRQTPLEGSFADTHALAARFDMDRED